MILSARDFALCRNVAESVVEETEIDNDFFIYLSYAVMSNAKTRNLPPVNGKKSFTFFSSRSESIAYLRGISTMVIYLTT